MRRESQHHLGNTARLGHFTLQTRRIVDQTLSPITIRAKFYICVFHLYFFSMKSDHVLNKDKALLRFTITERIFWVIQLLLVKCGASCMCLADTIVRSFVLVTNIRNKYSLKENVNKSWCYSIAAYVFWWSICKTRLG